MQTMILNMSAKFCGVRQPAYCHSISRQAQLVTRVNKQHTQAQTEVWVPLEKLSNLLECAVREENYQEAARLKRDIQHIQRHFQHVNKYIYHHLEVLRSSEVTEEKLAAVRALGTAGDSSILSTLALYLHQQPLNPAICRAMMSILKRSTNPEINDLMVKGLNIVYSSVNPENALPLFEQVIHLDPQFAEGHNSKAIVLYLQRRYEESIEVCKQVVKLQPTHFCAYSGMGLCFVALKRQKEAVCSFEKALAINPELVQIRRYLNIVKLTEQG